MVALKDKFARVNKINSLENLQNTLQHIFLRWCTFMEEHGSFLDISSLDIFSRYALNTVGYLVIYAKIPEPRDVTLTNFYFNLENDINDSFFALGNVITYNVFLLL